MKGNKHLNAFFAYSTDKENQLTRGLFVLLRLSPLICRKLYDHIFSLFDKEDQDKLPSPSEFKHSSLIFDTQKSGVTDIGAKLVAYLPITDDKFDVGVGEERDTKAIYDGVLAFPNQTIFLFENKPRVKNLNISQMLLSKHGIDPKIVRLTAQPTLIWRNIIMILRELLNSNEASQTEQALLRDYLTFIDEKFGYLNPFDTFGICMDNNELLLKRIRHIIENVSFTYKTKWHKNWAWSKIVDFPSLKQIDFRLDFDHSTLTWSTRLHLLFGSLNSEVKAFYSSNIQYADIQRLTDLGWRCSPVMHLSPVEAGVIALDTEGNCFPDSKLYFTYWKEHYRNVHKYTRKEYDSLVGEMTSRGILNISDKLRAKAQELIFDKKYMRLNFRPSFKLEFHYPKQALLSMEADGDIVQRIQAKINEALLPLTGRTIK